MLGRFVLKGIVMATTLGLLGVLAEGLARRMYDGESLLAYQLQSLEDRLPEVEVLAFGNSHIANGFNPHHLSKRGFNLAFPSQDLYYDSQLLARYAPRAPALRYVIISVDYYSIGYDQAQQSLHLARAYQDVAGIPPRDPYRIAFLASRLSLVRHRDRILTDLLTGRRPAPARFVDGDELIEPAAPGSVLYASGFSPNPDKNNTGNGRNRARIHTSQYDSSVREQNVQILHSMIGQCLAQGIRVLLITPPYTDGYREAFDPGLVEAFYKHISAVVDSYDAEQVCYQDFSHASAYPESLFANADHLSTEGARRFTRQLDCILAEWTNGTSPSYAKLELGLFPGSERN